MNAERVGAAAAERAARRVAGALARAGVADGERVAFCLPNSGPLLVALAATLRSGAVPVPLNPALLPHERQALLDDAAPALVIDSAGALHALFDGPEVDLAPHPRCRPMHYTSGTTGQPKGVWSGLLDGPLADALFREEVDAWGFDRDDVTLVCSPLYHSAPLRFAVATLLQGGDVVVLPKFDAAAAVAAVVEHRPTTAFMVPAHLQRLFAAGTLPPLTSFRLLQHAGAPCPPQLKAAAIAAFPAGTVWEFYGATEGQFTMCSPDEWEARPGTVGRARPGRRLSTDGDGTIWCEVPPHARFTYWRDPEKTARAWRGDAFTVGDLGRLDADGYLWLDGRRDDLVISGGVNVYPVEVELALAACPGVEEVAVFGVADERWGQRVCAAFIGDADPAAVRVWARERLAAYKVPKDVYRVDDLPRTGSGKVRRSMIGRVLGLEEAR